MSTPVQKLLLIENSLTMHVMTLSEIISEVTTSRPGLEAGLALLRAQTKLAEAGAAVSEAMHKLP